MSVIHSENDASNTDEMESPRRLSKRSKIGKGNTEKVKNRLIQQEQLEIDQAFKVEEEEVFQTEKPLK